MKKTALIVCPVFSVFLLKAQVPLEENKKLKKRMGRYGMLIRGFGLPVSHCFY